MTPMPTPTSTSTPTSTAPVPSACATTRALMPEALNDGSKRAAISAHVDSCPECARIWQELTALSRDLSDAAAAVEPKSPGFANSVLRSIRDEAGSPSTLAAREREAMALAMVSPATAPLPSGAPQHRPVARRAGEPIGGQFGSTSRANLKVISGRQEPTATTPLPAPPRRRGPSPLMIVAAGTALMIAGVSLLIAASSTGGGEAMADGNGNSATSNANDAGSSPSLRNATSNALEAPLTPSGNRLDASTTNDNAWTPNTNTWPLEPSDPTPAPNMPNDEGVIHLPNRPLPPNPTDTNSATNTPAAPIDDRPTDAADRPSDSPRPHADDARVERALATVHEIEATVLEQGITDAVQLKRALHQPLVRIARADVEIARQVLVALEADRDALSGNALVVRDAAIETLAELIERAEGDDDQDRPFRPDRDRPDRPDRPDRGGNPGGSRRGG